MRSRQERNSLGYGAGVLALLLLTCTVIILACTGTTGALEGTTPTATSASVTSTSTTAPPKPTATHTPHPTATATHSVQAAFHVTSASVLVNPAHYSGSCSSGVTVVFTYTFKVVATGPGGTISYQTYGPDGPPSGVSMVKAAAKQTSVTAKQTVDFDEGSIVADEAPYIVVSTIKPNAVTSSKANYSFACS